MAWPKSGAKTFLEAIIMTMSKINNFVGVSSQGRVKQSGLHQQMNVRRTA